MTAPLTLLVTERTGYHGYVMRLVVVVRDGVAVDWIERAPADLGRMVSLLIEWHLANRVGSSFVPSFPPGGVYDVTAWPRVVVRGEVSA